MKGLAHPAVWPNVKNHITTSLAVVKNRKYFFIQIQKNNPFTCFVCAFSDTVFCEVLNLIFILLYLVLICHMLILNIDL